MNFHTSHTEIIKLLNFPHPDTLINNSYYKNHPNERANDWSVLSAAYSNPNLLKYYLAPVIVKECSPAVQNLMKKFKSLIKYNPTWMIHTTASDKWNVNSSAEVHLSVYENKEDSVPSIPSSTPNIPVTESSAASDKWNVNSSAEVHLSVYENKEDSVPSIPSSTPNIPVTESSAASDKWNVNSSAEVHLSVYENKEDSVPSIPSSTPNIPVTESSAASDKWNVNSSAEVHLSVYENKEDSVPSIPSSTPNIPVTESSAASDKWNVNSSAGVQLCNSQSNKNKYYNLSSSRVNITVTDGENEVFLVINDSNKARTICNDTIICSDLIAETKDYPSLWDLAEVANLLNKKKQTDS